MLTEYGSFSPEKDISEGLHRMSQPDTGGVIFGSVASTAPGDSDLVRQCFEPAIKEVRCRKKRMRDEREQAHALLCTYLGGPQRMYRRCPKAQQKAGYLGNPFLSTLL